MVLLFEIASKYTLNKQQNVKLLIALPGIKEIIHNEFKLKEDCFNDSLEYTHSISNSLLDYRKHYGLKYHISLIIHVVISITIS